MPVKSQSCDLRDPGGHGIFHVAVGACGIIDQLMLAGYKMSGIRRNRSGFTLVEIMIVVAIIGLLAVIALPSFMKARSEALSKACINNLRQMSAAKEMAAVANMWPDNASAGTIGNPFYKDTCSAYIKGGERPKCPTGSLCYYNGLDEDPTCRSGIGTHVYGGE